MMQRSSIKIRPASHSAQFMAGSKPSTQAQASSTQLPPFLHISSSQPDSVSLVSSLLDVESDSLDVPVISPDVELSSSLDASALSPSVELDSFPVVPVLPKLSFVPTEPETVVVEDPESSEVSGVLSEPEVLSQPPLPVELEASSTLGSSTRHSCV